MRKGMLVAAVTLGGLVVAYADIADRGGAECRAIASGDASYSG
jgi:hypothetical protein